MAWAERFDEAAEDLAFLAGMQAAAEGAAADPAFAAEFDDLEREAAERCDAAVERDYELETGNQILECFQGRDPLHTPMVLVAGHAPFTWGKTPEKAVYHAAVLEELAKMAFVTRTLSPSAPPLPGSLVRKHFERKHGKNAYYGQK